MQSALTAVLCVLCLAASETSIIAAPASTGNLVERAHSERSAADDLEITGDLRGLASGSTRYLSREDLLALPQVTYTVKDDSNFTESTEISGVLLEELITRLVNDPKRDLVIAECIDQYHAHYPQSYLAAHHPILVLKINGQPPERWPKDAETHNLDMGPYLISHAEFKPTFKLLSHEEQAQVPWGVVSLEFRDEASLLTAIAPPARFSADTSVQTGYRIAQQNCLRCHNSGSVGGQQAHHPWLVLSAWATAAPEHFARYVRFPQAENPNAQMHPNPDYDDATLQALTAYFRSMLPSSQEKQ